MKKEFLAVCLGLVTASLIAGCSALDKFDSISGEDCLDPNPGFSLTLENKKTSKEEQTTASGKQQESKSNQPKNEPKDTPKETKANTPQETSSSAVEPTTVAKKGYTDEQLCAMARAYYKAKNGYEPPYVDVDREENGKVILHLYEVSSDHTATWDWYTVDRETAQGVDFFENKIDLKVK